MLKSEIREKCWYYGLTYSGKLDDKHWAYRPVNKEKPWAECIEYELTDEFLIKQI